MANVSFENYRVMSLAPFPHAVVLVTSEEEWDAIKGDILCTHDDWLGASAACVRDYENFSVVCLNPGGDLATYVGYIAHESTHVFQNLCKNCGEHSPSDEFEAYYIGHVTQWLLEQTLEQFMENPQNDEET